MLDNSQLYSILAPPDFINAIEKETGINITRQTTRMLYNPETEIHILNFSCEQLSEPVVWEIPIDKYMDGNIDLVTELLKMIVDALKEQQ